MNKGVEKLRQIELAERSEGLKLNSAVLNK